MLHTYTVNNTGVNLANGAVVSFNVDNVDTCCNISHTAGSPVIEINKAGYYLIIFSSFGYNTGAVVEGTDYSGTYSFQLNNKDVPVVNAVASASSTSNTMVENVMFSTILYVPPSCRAIDNNAFLTVKYLGQEGTILNGNLSIIRLR